MSTSATRPSAERRDRGRAVTHDRMATRTKLPRDEPARRPSPLVRSLPPDCPQGLVGARPLPAAGAGSFAAGPVICAEGGWSAGTPWSAGLRRDGA